MINRTQKKQINEKSDEPREQFFIDNVGSSSSEPWCVHIDVNKYKLQNRHRCRREHYQGKNMENFMKTKSLE